MKKQIIPFLVFLLLSSCSTQVEDKPDPTERTYPPAYNFKTVTINQLKTEIAPPDSLNIEAYVVAITYCPPDLQCIIGDNIIVSEIRKPDESDSRLFLSVTNSPQFEEGHLYVISLAITGGNNEGEKHFRLLGYSE